LDALRVKTRKASKSSGVSPLHSGRGARGDGEFLTLRKTYEVNHTILPCKYGGYIIGLTRSNLFHAPF
jgi:hypothetical protein